MFYDPTKFHFFGCLYLVRYWTYVNNDSLLTRLDVINFANNFSNQAVFSTGQENSLSILRKKKAFKMKLKVFFILFKRLSFIDANKTIYFER